MRKLVATFIHPDHTRWAHLLGKHDQTSGTTPMLRFYGPGGPRIMTVAQYAFPHEVHRQHCPEYTMILADTSVVGPLLPAPVQAAPYPGPQYFYEGDHVSQAEVLAKALQRITALEKDITRLNEAARRREEDRDRLDAALEGLQANGKLARETREMLLKLDNPVAKNLPNPFAMTVESLDKKMQDDQARRVRAENDLANRVDSLERILGRINGDRAADEQRFTDLKNSLKEDTGRVVADVGDIFDRLVALENKQSSTEKRVDGVVANATHALSTFRRRLRELETAQASGVSWSAAKEINRLAELVDAVSSRLDQLYTTADHKIDTVSKRLDAQVQRINNAGLK